MTTVVEISSTYYALLALELLTALLALLGAIFHAPGDYGRHRVDDITPTMNTRVAWLVMEAPACIGFFYFYFGGEQALQWVPIVFLVLWQMHYVHRAFIYPFRISPRSKTKVSMVFTSFLSCWLQAYLNAVWIAHYAQYDSQWFYSPFFIIGVTLFIIGFAINKQSDRILLALRRHAAQDYAVPHGGLFRYVTAPNYLGEILTWVGFSIATLSPAAVAFAIKSAVFLIPRAKAHHRWYQQMFADYPAQRKILVPFVW